MARREQRSERGEPPVLARHGFRNDPEVTVPLAQHGFRPEFAPLSQAEVSIGSGTGGQTCRRGLHARLQPRAVAERSALVRTPAPSACLLWKTETGRVVVVHNELQGGLRISVFDHDPAEVSPSNGRGVKCAEGVATRQVRHYGRGDKTCLGSVGFLRPVLGQVHTICMPNCSGGHQRVSIAIPYFAASRR